MGTKDVADNADLLREQEELLALLLKEEGFNASQTHKIAPREEKGAPPLSFAQQRLWFLDQLEPDNPFYNIPIAVRLTGPLNTEALEQSLNEIVRRHETLRTTFTTVDTQPVQIIVPALRVKVPVVDLRHLPVVEHELKVKQLVTEEVQRPFDLERGPLLRGSLLRLGATEHVLLVTMHHIVSDAWSGRIFTQELSTLYQAFLSGQPSPLPDLPIQYADFAVWQREWLQREVLERQLTYWKQQLTDALPVLELPTDRPRPPVQTYRGRTERFELDSDLTQRLEALSQQSGTTLFMTLLAAFVTLLARYSGQEDIVVGSPIANRNRKEIEPLIGFFVNTLVLRADLSGNPNFRELLGRVREVALAAYDHQDIPFEKLVEALQPERDLSRQPLFQVMFVLQDAPMATLELPGLTVSPVEVESGTAKFDLTLFIREDEQGLRGKLEYNTDLFDAVTITRMAGHFQTLMAGIVAHPEQRLSELPLLTEAERRQLLVEWNDTRTDYSKDQCIHQLFEAQVARTPDAIAVVFEEQQLTYQELNHRANQLAHYLQTLGVGPEVLVGICVERSLEMVIGVLGILKAGGTCVPLDPSYPQERLAFMLGDTQTPVLLTQELLLAGLPRHKAQVVCLNSYWKVIAGEGDENLLSGVTVENLVYVLYTSGSTGRPKGVALPHRALSNMIAWQLFHTTLPEGARMLQFSSLSFDASFTDIFVTWCSGGTLVIATDSVRRNIASLLQFITDRAIERLNLPFVVLQHLAGGIGAQTQPPLCVKEIISTAEQLQVTEPVRRLFAQLPNCSLHNQYGPSESHVATAFTLTGSPEGWPVLPPIGCPIANTQIYLLDRHLQPVPMGVPGELHIGGACLARGYLNRPDITAERFIPDPFSNEPGARLYKTGDLARYLPDGNIEFLGRLDHQVKIRGFRIELGEIETALGQHPAVREVVVMAREDLPGDKRLVAYFVVAQEPAPTPSELRNFLKEKLPDYMIPSACVRLGAMPLTPNGKVDRRALPAPDTSRPELRKTYVAPRNPVEQTLAVIWADVLGLNYVGVHDDFFELGGHSLQAVQLVSRMSIALNHALSVKDIFLYPTIAVLADALKNLPTTSHETSSDKVYIKPVKSNISTAHSPDFSLPSSSLLKIEHRPLLSLFATGKISPVDSAALAYLHRASFTHEPICNWFDNLPVCSRVIETSLGRTATILLPRFDSELYADEKSLVDVIIEALNLAKHLGARTVSLTGLIPSATNYGRAITLATAGQQDLPEVSTGHATTTATVILTIKRILQESGRDLAQERVGVLGLGSIGTASLRSMLKCLPHPPEIILCDLYGKLDVMERIKQEVVTDLGFRGAVRIAKSQTEVPPEFYEATLMIGATNVPDVLDITRLEPGTMIVDDSGPHCFKSELAIRRFEEREDILFTEGGVLKSPHPISELRYVPKEVAQVANLSELEASLRDLRYNPFTITGCVFSSLLSACFEDLKPTLGLVSVEACCQHYERLNQLGFQAADLHCEDYKLAEESIRNFRRCFGKQKNQE